MGIIDSDKGFEQAVSDFQAYKPIKVKRELKNKFNDFITKHFISMGINQWEFTIYPLKNSYKFLRKF